MGNLAVKAKISTGLKGTDWEEQLTLNEGEFQSSETGAQREKLDSIRYDYMPARIVNEAYARVADFGATKYSTDNWAKGLPVSQLASSLQRHLWAFMEGEDKDRESGLSHTDHVLWNAVALAYAVHHDLCDDRFKDRIVKYEKTS